MAYFQFDMSNEILQEALHLPGTSRIVDIRKGDNPYIFTFLVEESGLPPSPENSIARVVPFYHHEKITWDWNLEDKYGQMENAPDSQD